MNCYFCGEETDKPLCKICDQHLKIELYEKEWDLGLDPESFGEISTEVRIKCKSR